jgi:hypothetical protein
VSFLRLAYFPGGTEDHYAALAAVLGDVPEPRHRILFAAGRVGDGFQVVQVWDTRADLDRFNAEVFLPALTRLGVAGFPAPPVVTDVDLSHLSVRGA